MKRTLALVALILVCLAPTALFAAKSAAYVTTDQFCEGDLEVNAIESGQPVNVYLKGASVESLAGLSWTLYDKGKYVAEGTFEWLLCDLANNPDTVLASTGLDSTGLSGSYTLKVNFIGGGNFSADSFRVVAASE